MHRLFFLLFPFVFAACAVQKTTSDGASTPVVNYKIKLLWQVHTPYCGGAYPTPEQAMGWDSPLGNQEFVILYDDHLDLNKEHNLNVYGTDGDGIANLTLPKGTYYIYRAEKFETIEALEKKYRPTTDAQLIWSGIECLKQWQASPDLQLIVTGNMEATITENAQCFQGTTPCVNYVGPYPP
jgi:uncharacterized protein YejL (UPF0352 family)